MVQGAHTSTTPNIVGQPMVRYPKFVRSRGSHSWRQDVKGKRHGLGVTRWKGALALPEPAQAEQAMGYSRIRRDYTAFSRYPVRTKGGIGHLAVHLVPREEREAMLGDVFDFNLDFGHGGVQVQATEQQRPQPHKEEEAHKQTGQI